MIATVSEVCSKIYFEGDKIPYSNGTVVNQNDEFMKKTPLPEEIIPPSSEKFITNGLGRLALRLQSVIGLPRTNTVFSPLSVALALALVLLGSRGRTYIELTSALGLSNNTDKTLCVIIINLSSLCSNIVLFLITDMFNFKKDEYVFPAIYRVNHTTFCFSY